MYYYEQSCPECHHAWSFTDERADINCPQCDYDDVRVTYKCRAYD